MQNVLSTHRVGELQFDPAFVSFLAAANPPGIATGARNFKPPVCTRMMHCQWELPFEIFLDGETHGWPAPTPIVLSPTWEKDFTPAARGLVVGFLSKNGRPFFRESPENVTNWSRGVPRTWSRIRRICAALLSLDASDSLWRLAIGAVVPAAVDAFCEYRIMSTQISVADVLADPMGCELPERRDLAAVLSNLLITEVAALGTIGAYNTAAQFAKRLYDAEMGECCGPAMLRLARNIPPLQKGDRIDPSWAVWRPLGLALAQK